MSLQVMSVTNVEIIFASTDSPAIRTGEGQYPLVEIDPVPADSGGVWSKTVESARTASHIAPAAKGE